MLNLATFGLGVSAAAGLAEVWLEAAEPTAPAEAAAAFWPDRATTSSTTVRKSASIFSGWPEEYSAWNITFQEWQIMRSLSVGS